MPMLYHPGDIDKGLERRFLRNVFSNAFILFFCNGQGQGIRRGTNVGSQKTLVNIGLREPFESHHRGLLILRLTRASG